MTCTRARGGCVALVLAAVLACATGSDAAVRKPPRSVVAGGVDGAVAIDGGRLVAWNNGDGALRVLDDRTGERTDVSLGRPCERVYAIDGRGGLFLAQCGVLGAAGPETLEVVVDAESGEVTDLPASVYRRIGRYWVQGTVEADGRRYMIYTNWHSDETRTYRAPRRGQIYTPLDLDTPDLEPAALAGPEFVTGGSWAIAQVRRGSRYEVHVLGPTSDRVVDRSARHSELVSVKGGLALWQRGTRLFGYAYRAGKKLEWRVSDSAVVRGSTGRRVYYLTPDLGSPLFSTLRSFAWR